MARLPFRHASPLGRQAPALFVLVVGVLLALLAWRFVSREVERDQTERVRRAADELVSAVDERMNAYVSALMAVRGLFLASDDVKREEFGEFVASLELDRRYPGIQGIGYARRVDGPGKLSLEKRVQNEGFAGFHVWPPLAEDQFPVVFIEPFDWRNQRAFGFDMHSEPIRREAMDRARDTGEPEMTSPLELVQETRENRQPGFLVYLPDYAGTPDETAQGRRTALRGFVYAPFRAHDLLARVTREWTERHVAVEVEDAAEGEPVLFRSGGTAAAGAPAAVRQVEVLGRTWTLRLRETGPREVGERALPQVTLFGGLALALLFFAVAATQTRARHEAVVAGRRSDFLAETGRALGRSLDESATLATVADLATVLLGKWALVQVVDGEEAVAHACGPGAAAEAFRSRMRPSLARPRTGTGTPAAEVAKLAVETPPAGWEDRVVDWMAVPLGTRGRALGTLLVAREAGSPYGERELVLAQEFARIASTALENAQLYRQAREAVALREEFLGIASHELRTPLTAIRLQLQRAIRLAASIPEGQRLSRSIELSERQARRLTALVDGLLDIARIAHGRLELEVEEVDLAQVTREIALRHEEEALASGAALEVRAPDAMVARSDRLRIEQILTNLLSNAIKYGRGRPVRVELRREGATAVLTVADQGIGMSPDAAGRVFGRFERAVSARHYGGLGLGLYIVRQVVEALGGTIRVESEEGVGSTFTVELPLAGPAPHEAGAQKPGGPLQ